KKQDFDTIMAAADFESWLDANGYDITPAMFSTNDEQNANGQTEAEAALPQDQTNPLSEAQMAQVGDFYRGNLSWTEISENLDAYQTARSESGSPIVIRNGQQASETTGAEAGQTAPAASTTQTQNQTQNRTQTNFVSLAARFATVSDARLQAVVDAQQETPFAQAAQAIAADRNGQLSAVRDTLTESGVPQPQVDAVMKAIRTARQSALTNEIPASVTAALGAISGHSEAVQQSTDILNTYFSPVSVGVRAYQMDLQPAQVEKLSTYAGVPVIPASSWEQQRPLYQALTMIGLPDARVETLATPTGQLSGFALFPVTTTRADGGLPTMTVLPAGPHAAAINIPETGERIVVTRSAETANAGAITTVEITPAAGRVVQVRSTAAGAEAAWTNVAPTPTGTVVLKVGENGQPAGSLFRIAPATPVAPAAGTTATPEQTTLTFAIPQKISAYVVQATPASPTGTNPAAGAEAATSATSSNPAVPATPPAVTTFKTWIAAAGLSVTPDMFSDDAGVRAAALPMGRNPLSASDMTVVRDHYRGQASWGDITRRWDAYTAARTELGAPVETGPAARPAGAPTPSPVNYISLMAGVPSVGAARLQAAADVLPARPAQAAQAVIADQRAQVDAVTQILTTALTDAGLSPDQATPVIRAMTSYRGPATGETPRPVTQALARLAADPRVSAAVAQATPIVNSFFSPTSVGVRAYQLNLAPAEVQTISTLAGVGEIPAASWPAQRPLYQALTAVALPNTRVQSETTDGQTTLQVFAGASTTPIATIAATGPQVVEVRMAGTQDRVLFTRDDQDALVSIQVLPSAGRQVRVRAADSTWTPATATTAPG
ncbi:MAG: hypothetical protein JO102_03420, partial [Elusimicrobia bacterium]|nr:hypothetical protein [Elusimicrobiota bacterium]